MLLLEECSQHKQLSGNPALWSVFHCITLLPAVGGVKLPKGRTVLVSAKRELAEALNPGSWTSRFWCLPRWRDSNCRTEEKELWKVVFVVSVPGEQGWSPTKQVLLSHKAANMPESDLTQTNASFPGRNQSLWSQAPIKTTCVFSNEIAISTSLNQQKCFCPLR